MAIFNKNLKLNKGKTKGAVCSFAYDVRLLLLCLE